MFIHWISLPLLQNQYLLPDIILNQTWAYLSIPIFHVLITILKEYTGALAAYKHEVVVLEIRGANCMAKTSDSTKCFLMGLDGITYQALLGDISLSGASISIGNNSIHNLHVGEMCGLVLRNSSNMLSDKHTGRIVSLDSGSVGISFNHQEHRHLKTKMTN